METRKRLSSAEWDQIFVEQSQSGLSGSRFCQEHGIRASSYFSARKRQRMSLSRSAAEPGSVTSAARLVDHAASRSGAAHAAFVPVQLADETCDPPGPSSAIRVQLCSGHQLWVNAEFDASHLARLVSVLESA
jgi:hypothetical protein